MLIQIKDIKAVAYAMADKSERRKYLHGVLLETDGKNARIVATDGSRMHAVQFYANSDDEYHIVDPGRYILPPEFVKYVCKSKDAKNSSIIISINGNKLTAKLLDNEVATFDLIDGTYPDYTRIVPSDLSGGSAIYNPDYLADAQNGARDFNGMKKMTYPVMPNGDSVGVINLGDFIALVMPLRSDKMKLDAPGCNWQTQLHGATK